MPQPAIALVDLSVAAGTRRLLDHASLSVAKGELCLIVPVFDGIDIVDLAACSVRDRRIATRRDVGMALGRLFIARAAERQSRLALFADPLPWLKAGGRGAVVLDWSCAGFLFDGVPEIACCPPDLARRVHATTRRMARPPRLFFPKQRIFKHAA